MRSRPSPGSALAVLGSLTGLLEAGLLALLDARVTVQHAGLLERGTTCLLVDGVEAAGDPEPQGAGLAGEDPLQSRRESYDVVTARAVGRLSTLAELASPLLRPGGVLVAWKGKRDEEEEQQMARAAESLSMTPEQILDVGHRAGSEHRHLHVLRKSGPTPANLPRKPGLAKKRPRG